MESPAMARSSPPRFVVKATIATLVMVAGVLTAVFVGVALNVRERVRGAATDKLEAGQRMLSALEQRRARELSVQVATLAENATLKAAVATYKLDLGISDARLRRGMITAIERELEKLASRAAADVLAATDESGTVLAVAGRRHAAWPRQTQVHAHHGGSNSDYVSLSSGVFQFASAPLVLQNTVVGSLQLGKALDDRYAQELSTLSGAATLIASGDKAIASTLSDDLRSAVTPRVLQMLPASGIVKLAGSEYAVRLLFQDGEAKVYALDSIDASTRVPMRDAYRNMLIIAIEALALAAFASVWLAQTIARPIDTLSKSLSQMTTTRDFDNPVPATGSSLEVDTLTTAFNTMMRSVSAAEAAKESAYVGAIRALALALDARDPYTAGHSERVSAVSVSIARQMQLPEDQVEILRLGALLHDIGKIGISDAVLRKPGPLTPDEFELIKKHPGVGARILRSVHFLAPHVPIVELHHERPDGQGYPYRLRGTEIPLFARIVHVADAFDAITSARAYRRARGKPEALRELWRWAGTQFDADVVKALALVLPSIQVASEVRELVEAPIAAPRRAVGGSQVVLHRSARDRQVLHDRSSR
jgi:putative nucleotidyltransferase with HDIG domain